MFSVLMENTWTMMHIWKSEYAMELILPLHHYVGIRSQIQGLYRKYIAYCPILSAQCIILIKP